MLNVDPKMSSLYYSVEVHGLKKGTA